MIGRVHMGDHSANCMVILYASYEHICSVMWTKMVQNMVYWQEVVKVCLKKNQGFTVVLNR